MWSLITYHRCEGNGMAKLVWTQRGVTQNETGSVVQNSCANQITALPEIKK